MGFNSLYLITGGRAPPLNPVSDPEMFKMINNARLV